MKTESLRAVKNNLSRVIEELPETGTVLITKSGRTRAALIPVDEQTDLETLVIAQNRRFWDPGAAGDARRVRISPGEDVSQRSRCRTKSAHGVDHRSEPQHRCRDRGCVRRGWTTMFNAREAEGLSEVAAERARLIEAIERLGGGVDVLVKNAASGDGPARASKERRNVPRRARGQRDGARMA